MFRRSVVPLILMVIAAWSISVQAMPITYIAQLSGAAEDPPVASTGSGFATVVYDPGAHTLSVAVTFADLVGVTTVAHIHCCTAAPFTGNIGVATSTPTFPGFPAGVQAGSYSQLFDLTLASSFNPAFVIVNGGNLSGAEDALAAGLAEGRAYFNIHTNVFPGGEIRGFLRMPEPGTLSLFGLGLAGVLVAGSWRRTRLIH